MTVFDDIAGRVGLDLNVNTAVFAVRMTISVSPYIGDLNDAIAVATGYDVIWGEHLSYEDRMLYATAMIMPGVGGRMLTKADDVSSLAARGLGPGKITGYTSHGVDQAISRDGVGVSTRAIRDSVKSPLKVKLQADGTWRYTGIDATVVLNPQGKVVTTWARNRQGWRTAAGGP